MFLPVSVEHKLWTIAACCTSTRVSAIRPDQAQLHCPASRVGLSIQADEETYLLTRRIYQRNMRSLLWCGFPLNVVCAASVSIVPALWDHYVKQKIVITQKVPPTVY